MHAEVRFQHVDEFHQIQIKSVAKWRSYVLKGLRSISDRIQGAEAVNRGYKVVAECRCRVRSCICCSQPHTGRPATLTLLTTTTRINIVQTKNTKKPPSAPFFSCESDSRDSIVRPSVRLSVMVF